MTKIKKEKKDNLGYAGKVEIGVVVKGKKHKKVIKNAGKKGLFEFVRDCLAGRGNNSKRPGQVKLYNNATPLTTYGINFNDISLLTATDTAASISIYFLIPGTIILNKRFNKVELLSVDGLTSLADASFGEDIEVTQVDTNVYINWTLTIKNA